MSAQLMTSQREDLVILLCLIVCQVAMVCLIRKLGFGQIHHINICNCLCYKDLANVYTEKKIKTVVEINR